jgi:hypothetical protein
MEKALIKILLVNIGTLLVITTVFLHRSRTNHFPVTRLGCGGGEKKAIIALQVEKYGFCDSVPSKGRFHSTSKKYIP